MRRLKVRIYNERVKSACAIVNALASAVVVLAFIRPKLDEEKDFLNPLGVMDSEKIAWLIEAGAIIETTITLWWLFWALVAYVLAFWALGLLRDES